MMEFIANMEYIVHTQGQVFESMVKGGYRNSEVGGGSNLRNV